MSMPDVFDPYRKWLGIPPAEQPPNHYRLLGVGLFEDDADTIAGAADRQMGHVRTFQTGPHSTLSQKLLNELSAARLCLLDPKKKSEYDKALRTKLDAAATAGQGMGAPAATPGLKPSNAVAASTTPTPRPSSTAVTAPIPVAAGQGRGDVAGTIPPTSTSDAPLVAPTSSGRSGTSRRKRSRREPAVWVGLAAAVIALAVVIYFLRAQAAKEAGPQPGARIVAQTSPRESGATLEDGPPDSTSADETSSPQKMDEEDSPASEGATNDTAGNDASVLSSEPAEQSRDDKPADAAAPTVAFEKPADEKRRSLSDLANIAERPQLAQTHRESPPQGKVLTAAQARFVQMYGKEIADAKGGDAVLKLTVRLYNLAREGANTSDLRYVMLANVGSSAVNQGRIGLAYSAATEVARQFEVDPFAVKLNALEASAKASQTAEAQAIGVLQALSVADRAAAEGKLDVASKAASQATQFARKTKDKDLIAQTERRKGALREQSARSAAYKKALSDLKKAHDDQQANLTAGKYEALVLGNWAEGLAKLANSGETRLAEIAYLAAEARLDPAQWAPLATAWWHAAEEEEVDFFKPLCRLEAKYCYLRARKAGRGGELPAEMVEQLKGLPGYPLSRLLPGAAVRYYDGAAFEREKLQRADPAIDFFFGPGSPDPSVSTDFFSARWTGFLKPPVSGRYRIVTHTDNSVRLWVDGKEVLNRWGSAVAGWQQVSLELTDEPHTFRFEFNDTIGAAIAMFGWSLAAFPDEQHLQWSPIDALYYDPESPFDLPDLP